MAAEKLSFENLTVAWLKIMSHVSKTQNLAWIGINNAKIPC
jgi:hypothetical protein